MNRVDLVYRDHQIKVGNICGHIQPNITENSYLCLNGEIIGFYLNNLNDFPDLKKYVSIANSEFLSKNVPKSEMKRSSGFKDKQYDVKQYSTILGAIPPKPHMKRNYVSMSSVHQHKPASTFIKAMYLTCLESEKVIQQLAPNIYESQKEIFESRVEKKWRFGNLFTSSISNYNISAPFHIDGGNIEGCVNVIIAKKKDAQGGNTTVPDYGATFDSCDNSMLVYPAWKNVHGVTPIIPLREGGYRNSLVFYPLKAFLIK